MSDCAWKFRNNALWDTCCNKYLIKIYLLWISVTTLPPLWLELISAASTKLLAGVTAVAGGVSMVIVTSPVDLIICEGCDESTTGAVVGAPRDNTCVYSLNR